MKRSGKPAEKESGPTAPPQRPPGASASSNEEASAPATPAVPLEEQVEKNFRAEGGYWKGEGKMTEMTLPGPRPIPEMIDKLVPIIAQGGWEISSVSREGGSISGSQSISTLSGSGKVVLNVFATKTAQGGARVVLTIKSPAGSKVTDKEAKKIFDRIAKAMS
jgi:hypothetical protein